MPDPIPYKYTDDINGYKAAVWDFLLEHCEITKAGGIFVKFAVSDKKNFENRVLGRWKHNYHREDVVAKAKKVEEKKKLHKETKKQKREKHRAAKKARMALLPQKSAYISLINE